jgi:hypothetical protein
MAMRIVTRFLLLASLTVAVTSCGDVVRQSRAPVLLVLDLLEAAQGNHSQTFFTNLTSDVITLVTQPAPCTSENPCPTIFNDVGRVTLRIVPKDIGPPGSTTVPTSNNDVTVNRIRVSYRRTDGRNVEGIDIPYSYDTAATGTVSASGTLSLGFELVRNNAKVETPLIQLRTSGVIINAIADVTVFGRDQVGNDVSVSGSIGVAFGNFGDS